MSSLLSETTRALGLGAEGDAARTTVGVLAIATLLSVLVVGEMARAELTGARARRLQHLRFVTVPLTVVFMAVVTPRILELLT
jgi:hypothetical protein